MGSLAVELFPGHFRQGFSAKSSTVVLALLALVVRWINHIFCLFSSAHFDGRWPVVGGHGGYKAREQERGFRLMENWFVVEEIDPLLSTVNGQRSEQLS